MTKDNPQNLRNKKILRCMSLSVPRIQNMPLGVTVTHLSILERNTKMLQRFHCITIKDLMFSQTTSQY